MKGTVIDGIPYLQVGSIQFLYQFNCFIKQNPLRGWISQDAALVGKG